MSKHPSITAEERGPGDVEGEGEDQRVTPRKLAEHADGAGVVG
jgi:hypothetical protein